MLSTQRPYPRSPAEGKCGDDSALVAFATLYTAHAKQPAQYGALCICCAAACASPTAGAASRIGIGCPTVDNTRAPADDVGLRHESRISDTLRGIGA